MKMEENFRGKDGTSDPAIENENTYRQYLDKSSGPLPRDWFVMAFLNQSANERLFDTQKPEKLIQKLILASTNSNDLVVDFFGGSGTTASVAHKLDRQYLTCEQLDRQVEIIDSRLRNVIQGDQSGISKEISWQGGGSFTYLELKKYNQELIDRIEIAKSTKKLLGIWEEMKDRSFLNYNVDIKKQEEHMDEFKKLTLEEQKQLLCELLDKNQLYVNVSSLEDTDFACTEEEKKVTRDFYRK